MWHFSSTIKGGYFHLSLFPPFLNQKGGFESMEIWDKFHQTIGANCKWRSYQQNYVQLYQYTQLKVTHYFYSLRSAPYFTRSSIILQAQKLCKSCSENDGEIDPWMMMTTRTMMMMQIQVWKVTNNLQRKFIFHFHSLLSEPGISLFERYLTKNLKIVSFLMTLNR